MPRYFHLVVMGILFSRSVFAQFTVHVVNPWSSDSCAGHRDSLHMAGNNVVGFYPGSAMTPEGGNWFYFTYQTSAVSFQIVDWCGPSVWQGRVVYRYSISLDSMIMHFFADTNSNEFWIVIADTSQPPQISNYPPGETKAAYFLGPRDLRASPCPSFKIKYTSSSLIKFMLPSDVSSIGIYDFNGRGIQRLKPLGAQVVWNGISAAGKPVPSGRYFIKIVEGKAIRVWEFTVIR